MESIKEGGPGVGAHGGVSLGDFKSVATVHPEGTYFDTNSVAGADLIDDITILSNGVLRAHIYISGVAVATLTATIDRGVTTATVGFNGNADLTVETLYTFDMPVREGDVVNYQLDDVVKVEVFNVDFIPNQKS